MNRKFNNHTFFIKKNSTLPELKFELGFHLRQKYDITDEMMENVGVTFSMIDSETGLYKIANREAKLIISPNQNEYLDTNKYELAYRFKLRDTNKVGRYEGEFTIDFIGNEYCGKIKLPTDDEISIIISDSITKTTIV